MSTVSRNRFGSGGRRRPRRSWRAGVLGALAVAVVCPPTAPGQESYDWPEVRTSEPVEKEFTVVQRYHYRERLYDPPARVKTLAEAPAAYSGPEEVVAGLVSAMKDLDYEWWLETWDAASRKLIVERDDAMGVTKEQRLETWSQKVGKTDASLVRWVETGQYVILTYRRRSAEGEGEEQPVAVKLSDSGWAATLDLVDDPVFRHVTTDEQRIEKTVR